MKTLIIDDDIETLKCYENCLNESEKDSVDFITNPSEALNLLRNKNKKYTRIVTEMFFRNSEITALDILELSFGKNINERIILTAFSHPIDKENMKATLILRKPITKKKIKTLVSEPIDRIKSHATSSYFSKYKIYSEANIVFT